MRNKTKRPNSNKKHKLNDEIRGEEVRLVGSNVEEGVYNISEARKIAYDMNKDLVLFGPKSSPVVCKIMDYKKHLYEQEKKKPKVKSLPLKEMRFTPNTSKGDMKFKTNHIEKFIEKGHRVKAYVFFKGREMAFKDRGKELLLNLAVELEDIATAESMPKMEGRKMNMFFKPKK